MNVILYKKVFVWCVVEQIKSFEVGFKQQMPMGKQITLFKCTQIRMLFKREMTQQQTESKHFYWCCWWIWWLRVRKMMIRMPGHSSQKHKNNHYTNNNGNDTNIIIVIINKGWKKAWGKNSNSHLCYSYNNNVLGLERKIWFYHAPAKPTTTTTTIPVF